MSSKTTTDDKPKRPWEIRSLIFIGRFFAALCFCTYALFAASMSWSWVKVKMNRAKPLEYVVELTYKSIPAGKPEKVFDWIAGRPKSELDDIMLLLEPYAGESSPYIFNLYSHHKRQQGEIEEALFWQQYFRYRIRFDALRCGAKDGPELVSKILQIVGDPTFTALFPRSAEKQRALIQRVLDYDAHHPAANLPIATCDLVYGAAQQEYKPVQRAKWASVRHSLRIATEHLMTQFVDLPPAASTDPDLKAQEKPEPEAETAPEPEPETTQAVTP